ncbi:hypothetical protein K469DRAFT_83938 [Zopfia rhizophila CBS 207.26]|uniref:Fungal N-terminal domain-containing protein n=1 Tax=Zopfia rhizophila CBS 207.26 TaxID=1314779 RepID=A0A6A6EDK0_9PEZI|nr:hypothetical protein K469DRAFT_83938 [Zopfia rhizophila CBS 207.26]
MNSSARELKSSSHPSCPVPEIQSSGYRRRKMEAAAIFSLAVNVFQLIDFSQRLISKSTELYRSNQGALAENIDVETATKHLLVINKKIEDAANAAGNHIPRLCISCTCVANDLLQALDDVKVKEGQKKWKSVRKALLYVRSKREIEGLEKRLSMLREELILHLMFQLRYLCMSALVYAAEYFGYREQTDQQSGAFQDLDSATRDILDVLASRDQVFQMNHDREIALIRGLHDGTLRSLKEVQRELAGQAAINSESQSALIMAGNSMTSSISALLTNGILKNLEKLVGLAIILVSIQEIYQAIMEMKPAVASIDQRWTFFQVPCKLEDARWGVFIQCHLNIV